MRIVTVNLNGIRAAARKGFFTWLEKQDADVVCMQETKAQQEQLRDKPIFYPEGYHCYYFDASVRKGYSGVALYARQEPERLTRDLGWSEFDAEGRYIEAQFGKLAVASLYLPSGSSSEQRQEAKNRFMDLLMPRLKKMSQSGLEYIICGDWNNAHKQIDLKNWRGNQKNSGFLPHERAWMDALFGPAGYVDAFRRVNQQEDQYTWWSSRGQAWAKNVGWRIDYQVVTRNLAERVKAAAIYTDERFSDHAPLTMDYDLGSL